MYELCDDRINNSKKLVIVTEKLINKQRELGKIAKTVKANVACVWDLWKFNYKAKNPNRIISQFTKQQNSTNSQQSQ